MIKYLNYIDWKWIWYHIRYPLAVITLLLSVCFLMVLCIGCTTTPTANIATAEKAKIEEDPLAPHKNKMKLIERLDEIYGQPELWWSYGDDEVTIELYRWDLKGSYRYAIKVNGRYKNTWTHHKEGK